jgi:hypothetical protein
MFEEIYERMVTFASDGELAEELTRARGEYVARTGDLFETDPNYEHRIAAFLEWYTLDRLVSSHNMTPAGLYIDRVTQTGEATPPELQRIRDLSRTTLSLFEFRRARREHIEVVDLLSKTKLRINERRKPAGLESGDILEARIVPCDEMLFFSEVFCVHPREARKAILGATKAFHKAGVEDGRIDLVHRVAYLANRSLRYKHVNPKKIFEEL